MSRSPRGLRQASLPLTLLFLAVVMRPGFADAQSAVAIEVRQAAHHDISPRLRDIAPVPAFSGEKHERPPRPIPMPPQSAAPDGALQTSPSAILTATPTGGFDGVGLPNYSVNAAPPDTNGSVSATQYVQWVNEAFAVFDKSTGAIVYGPANGNTLWSGFGGACQTYNDGDPIVLFDKAAQRWIFSQFAVTQGTPYLQCVAVSTTSDATGPYARYSFSYTNFNDYPKIGIWPDAYYVSYNMFRSNRFQGARACALDRAKMLAGQAATQVCAQLSTAYGGLLPSDVDGNTPPPAGSPNYFVSFGTNNLNLWKFSVNWTTPANSTFTGPTSIPVATFSTACSGGTCIPQTGTTQKLDSLGDRLMYRLAYRNFGDHESLVVNHSVVAGTSVGVRWYELRSPNTTPVVYQQGTYAPDATYRWMGSAAMDGAGNIALGYSASSATLSPGIRMTGRLASDPLNTLQSETSIYVGGGSQLATLARWGDYSSVSVDPADDCTFWFTTEYLKSSGTFNWSTRIASFSFPGCSTTLPPPPSAPTGLSASGGNAQVSLSWTASSGATSYKIYRGTTSGGETLLISGIAATTYVDSTAVNSTTYYYQVSAVNAGGESAKSSEASATPQVPAPAAPTGLAATAGNAQVSLNWTASSGATSYRVYRGTTSGGETLLISGVATTTYVDSAAVNGTTYYYQVSAVNAGGESAKSSEASATPQVPAPAAPTGLSASAGNAQVSLSWTASSGATSYKVYRGTTSGGETLLTSGVATTTYVDSTAVNGTTYYYQASAVNAGGESAKSSEASATPQAPVLPPAAPTGLVATASNAQISLSWTAASGATSYKLYRGTSSGGETLLTSALASTSYIDSTATNGTTYYYQVSAVNAGGESARSSEASATPQGGTANLDFGASGLTFAKNQGYIVDPGVSDPTNYSVLAKFSIDSTNGWVKLLDFHQGTSDLGLYSYNGYLYFYGFASNLSTLVFSPGQTVTLIETRGSDGQLKVYANGVLLLSFTDSNNTLTNPLWILKDDAVSGGAESSSGVLYKIQTFNGVLTQTDVSNLSGNASLPPTAPSGLAAGGGNAQVSLSWTASSGATSYKVYRGTSSGGETLLASGVSSASYVDSTATNGTTYYYQVSAVNGAGESARSSEASATPAAGTVNLDFGVSGLVFAKNQGYIVDPGVSDPTNYSVLVKFSIDSTNGWVKLLDFHQGTSDLGLYSYNDYLYFYGFASNLSTLVFSPAQTVTLIQTRGSDGQLKVYANGVLLLSFADSNNTLSSPLWILKDDAVSGGAESSSGVLYKIQTLNGVLTQSQVTTLSQ